MITIKKAVLKDVPTVVKLWEEFMEYHDEVVLKNNPKLKPYLIKKKDAPELYRKFVKEKIKSKQGAVFIAEVDGKPAGFCLIFIKDAIPIFKLEKIGYISDLFVKKEFRGQRISSKLKDEVIKWFKSKGLNHMSIALYIDNEFAHSIYKKWGFFDYHIEMRRKI